MYDLTKFYLWKEWRIQFHHTVYSPNSPLPREVVEDCKMRALSAFEAECLEIAPESINVHEFKDVYGQHAVCVSFGCRKKQSNDPAL